jgi:uncharacterized protein YbjT (DUF2867 family)
MILVTGATGLIGRELISRLRLEHTAVRALSRHPATAALPAGVEVAGGDLTDAATLAAPLHGVQAVYVFAGGRVTDEFAKSAKEAGVQRIVVTSGLDNDPDLIEHPLTKAGLEWVHLRPTAFAANALRHWGQMIRAAAVVRAPYGDAAAAPIHETDIADVARAALCDGVPATRRYELTGPQSLTHREQAAVIAETLDCDITFVEETPNQARTRMINHGIPEPIVDRLLTVWAANVGQTATVSPAVEELTGHPAHNFAQWVAEHAGDFR